MKKSLAFLLSLLILLTIPFSVPVVVNAATTEPEISIETVENAKKVSDTAIIVIGRTAGEDRDNSASEGSYLLAPKEDKGNIVISNMYVIIVKAHIFYKAAFRVNTVNRNLFAMPMRFITRFNSNGNFYKLAVVLCKI